MNEIEYWSDEAVHQRQKYIVAAALFLKECKGDYSLEDSEWFDGEVERVVNELFREE